MKYQTEAKLQIVQTMASTNCCVYAFLSAIILTGATKIEPELIELPYFDDPTFEYLSGKLQDIYSTNIEVEKVSFAGKQFILLTGKVIPKLIDDLSIDVVNRVAYSRACENDCCRLAFVKGAFVTTGKVYITEDVNMASKGYGLEFVLSTKPLAEMVSALAQNVEIYLKSTRRIGKFVLYLRDSDAICDALMRMGAVKASLDFQNELAIRSVKNDVNRQNNCFDANQNKTITVSLLQIAAIEIVKNKVGLSFLPNNLKEVAMLRTDNPDASLSELCELSSKPITRAGMKYKLDRIISIARKIKGN